MHYYTPLFSKIVDSSLWCEPDHVVKVFITMLAKKDPDWIVRGNAYNIAMWSKKTEAEVLEAIKVLESPDTIRIESQPFDGRRIQRVKDGFLILNGEHYQKQMKLLHQKASNAERQRRWRQRHHRNPEPEAETFKGAQP